ncbi:ribonuclease HII [Clostridium sediminicola]|uniref:ribonuclease HII n=1 Tax=Clostridium sediminicola TaxID=3114879 RepID=UPI0031F1FDF6
MIYEFSKLKVNEVKEIVNKEIQNQSTIIEELINPLKSDSRKAVQKLGFKVEKYIYDLNSEIARVKSMYEFDTAFLQDKNMVIAGVDEVGRGPLAGPIVSAAVILDLDIKENKDLILKINDSKKINEKTREELDSIIKEKALYYNIVALDNKDIDHMGIAWCNNEVLLRAVTGIKTNIDLVLSDGYKIKNCPINNEHVIKGDSKSASIACASIIAKVYRDRLMKKYHGSYPEYAFSKNVGYGTKEHIDSIIKYGVTEIHRKSFLKNIVK